MGTMPSLAPSTPVRSQFRCRARLSVWFFGVEPC